MAVEGRPDLARPGLHHPTRHQLRDDLRRHGPRTSTGGRVDHRRAARRRRGAAASGGRGERDRAHGRGRCRGARQAWRLHRHPRGQPVHRGRRPALRGRLRAHGLRHGGDHGRTGRGRARLGLRHGARAARSCAPCSLPRDGTSRAAARTRATARRSTAASSTDSTSPRRRPGPSSGSRTRASESAKSTTGCAIGSSRASGSGVARSPPCTARPTASCRCPRTSSPWWPPTMWSSSPPASHRSPRTMGSCTRPARSVVARRVARPTPWTPSWTRRGTSCASAIPGAPIDRSTRPWPVTSCRSTSTSAGSSTPSCTCSTPGSSPGPSLTWGWRRGSSASPSGTTWRRA